MRIFLIYSLPLIVFHSVVGMQLTNMPLRMKKRFARNVINKSEELDAIRKRLSTQDCFKGIKNIKDIFQGKVARNIRDISQGKIIIKEELPLGKRYGVCHNYAFTKLMGIVGKAPRMLNIEGQIDYYAGNGIDILEFFTPVEGLPQSGDIAVYLSQKTINSIDNITHTGIVVGHDCIESKWGAIPAVFEHPTWYVPTSFGVITYYWSPKITGHNLLVAVQKKLKKKRIKKQYDVIGRQSQQELFSLINCFEQEPGCNNLYKIYRTLESSMNIQINVPDKNGLTPRMHAEKIGYKELTNFIAAYEKNQE